MTEAGQWWVYLIANATGRSYVGATYGIDAGRRLAEHNGGLSRAAKATRGRGPWVLIHVEPAPDKSAALSREWHLKHDRRQRRALLTAYLAQIAAGS